MKIGFSWISRSVGWALQASFASHAASAAIPRRIQGQIGEICGWLLMVGSSTSNSIFIGLGVTLQSNKLQISPNFQFWDITYLPH